MKPVVLGISAVIGLLMMHFGLACSPGFVVLEEGSMELSSCAQDESSLAPPPAVPKVGYLQSKQVVYEDRGDGWILVEGDKLYRAKGGLPRKPLPAGISQGVGVPTSGRWPAGKIPYVIASNLANQQRVVDAVNHWNSSLNGTITWVSRTNETDYVEFRQVQNGCAAPVGYYAGEGIHPIETAAACTSGNVAHEMGHIVGLDHEQNRLDRNDFVTIYLDRVMVGYEPNFNITSSHKNYQKYDFGSIMHYGLAAFSKDGSQTIVPKVVVPTGTVIGQRKSLSQGDIDSVVEMYGGTSNGGGGTPMTPNPPASGGLYGRYYRTVSFNELGAERVDETINFDWGSGAPGTGLPADNFSVRWAGWIRPSADGLYEIIGKGQDGYRLILDGRTLMDRLSSTGYGQQQSAALQMKAGQKYRVIIEVVARVGSASFRLGWRKDGAAEVLIPSTDLIPDTASDLQSNLCTGF